MSEANRVIDRGASGLSPILSHEETGALMGISERYAWKLEQRALAKLRRELSRMNLSEQDVFTGEWRTRVRELRVAR